MTNNIPDLIDIAENLAELLTNSVNIVDKYYDMFFNETPMLVELQQYNSQGVLETHYVPNLAMNRSIALSGEVDPENVVSGNLGQLYVNTVTRNVFLKATAVGKTGWVNITPGKMYIMRETFGISSSTTSVTLTQSVGSKDHTILFLNKSYVEVSQYTVVGNTLNLLFNAPDNSTLEVRYFINVATADSEVIRIAQGYANDAKNYRDQTIALQISTITIGTVEESDTAYVINSGTSSNQVWDIGLPRGPQGPQGPVGPQGKSVTSVELLSTAGIHKTYRMHFSDGTYFDYTVDDGESLPATWGTISGNINNQADLQGQLSAKQDTITDLNDIRSNALNGQSAYTTISGYGDIVTHDTSEFATAAQGAKADTAAQIGDPVSYFQNNVGYLTSINSSQVVSALGYTPYDSANPNNYITLNNLSSSSNEITYNNGTGVFSITSGYSIPTSSQVALISTALQPGALDGYATETWVTNKNYITLGSLSSTIAAISYNSGTGEFSLVQGYQIPTEEQVTKIDTAVQQDEVEDNLTSESTTNVLSANQGRVLDEKITALASRGKFLAVWNSPTGLPSTAPGTLPYSYTTGDYYIIGSTGTTNYRPEGSIYTGAASTTVETNPVSPNDTYLYDGTSWSLIHTDVGTITFSSLAGQPTDNTNLANALGNKVTKNNAITAGTATKITYDAKGLVTAGTTLSASDIPNLTLAKITDVTASVAEINTLDGITATTTELNYTDGVTSNIQTQLNTKATDTTVVHLAGTETVSGTKTFTGNPVFQGSNWDNSLTIKRNTNSGAAIKFINTTGNLGTIGIRDTGYPQFMDASSNAYYLARIPYGSAVGSTTKPVYIDANGTATVCNTMCDLVSAQTITGNKTISSTLTLTKTTNASGTADNKPALIVGGTSTQAHIEIDNNEVMAKSSATTTADLHLNHENNDVVINEANTANTVRLGNHRIQLAGVATMNYNSTTQALDFNFS